MTMMALAFIIGIGVFCPRIAFALVAILISVWFWAHPQELELVRHLLN